MSTMKMDKKQFTEFMTFQNTNKIIATILSLSTTYSFFIGDFKLMLVLFTFSLVIIFTLSTIDYSIKTNKNKKEISSPFADLMNKQTQLVHEQKSRSEVQGAAKENDLATKTDGEIVEELKVGLNKNIDNSNSSNPTSSRKPKSNPKKNYDDLFENKNKPTYPLNSSSSSMNDLSDLFLKDEGQDDDRLI